MPNKEIYIACDLWDEFGGLIRSLPVGGKFVRGDKLTKLISGVEAERTDTQGIWHFTVDSLVWSFIGRVTFDDPKGEKKQIGINLSDGVAGLNVRIGFMQDKQGNISEALVDCIGGGNRDDGVLDNIAKWEEQKKTMEVVEAWVTGGITSSVLA